MDKNIIDKKDEILDISDFFEIEKEYINKNLSEFNIILCGSARVGKSTLINALCNKKVAETSGSLASCTKKVEKYIVDGFNSKTNTSYKINFWDSPGIESWNEKDVKNFITDIVQISNPICMIYCASPGSFANLDQLDWIIQNCYGLKIFCALVCTNMWSNRNRNLVIKDFNKIMSKYSDEIYKEEEITYYGDIGLVTMINSKDYNDEELGVHKAQQGINELIYGIMKSLKDEKLIGWCCAVLENRSFWIKMKHKLIGFYNEIIPETKEKIINTTKEYTINVIDFIF